MIQFSRHTPLNKGPFLLIQYDLLNSELKKLYSLVKREQPISFLV